ncbi:MAG TPA: hypothetical protein VIR33_06930, partial [Thermopolyspora sp.]
MSEPLESARDKYLTCHPDVGRNTSPSAAAIRCAREPGLCRPQGRCGPASARRRANSAVAAAGSSASVM